MPLDQVPEAWSFSRRVNYHETDAMGVAHHTHYLRFYEEARVAWIGEMGLGKYHFPVIDVHWAVLETTVQHFKPALFDKTLRIFIQVKRQGLKLGFQYATYSNESDECISVGETWLVPVSGELKPVKVPQEVKDVFKRHEWTETWL